MFAVRPLRALLETWGVAILLIVLLLADPQPLVVVRITTGWYGIICVVYLALRLRILPTRTGALLEDAFLGICASVSLLVMFLYLKPSELLPDVQEYLLGFSSIAFLVYISLRLITRLWWLWSRSRVRRLRWSFVHGQFITLLLLLGVFLVIQAVQLSSTVTIGSELLQITSVSSLITAALLILTFLTFIVIISTPVIILLMAVGSAVSYRIARRTVSRIEALAVTAARLRGGDYSARVAVMGEDEIAQLQQDFNAMAAELERALTSLKQERDTVSGLLQTRRELMAAVSHELRTPIAGIRGYVESALANWQTDAPPPTLRSDLEKVESEAQQLGRLIDDLFTLSRAEVGKLTLRNEPTDTASLIRRVVEVTAPLAWRNQRVSVGTELAVDLPTVLADAARLEQILLNLIHNALRHTRPGGIVVVAAQTEADLVRIEVRDTGEGIAPDQLPRIWDRFYRGEKGDGAGLGLSIVKELAEAMGGAVNVSSTIGHGSIFSLRLRQVCDNSAESD